MRRPRRCHVDYLAKKNGRLEHEIKAVERDIISQGTPYSRGITGISETSSTMTTFKVFDCGHTDSKSKDDDFQPPLVTRTNVALFQQKRMTKRRKRRDCSNIDFADACAVSNKRIMNTDNSIITIRKDAYQDNKLQSTVAEQDGVDIDTCGSGSSTNDALEIYGLLPARDHRATNFHNAASVDNVGLKRAFAARFERGKTSLVDESSLFYSDRNACDTISYQRISAVRWSAINRP